MTKIKNTKKGMAKKTLSMSLVVAMLATSNVPVWAAEFSDGTDAAVASEADTFTADETENPNRAAITRRCPVLSPAFAAAFAEPALYEQPFGLHAAFFPVASV